MKTPILIAGPCAAESREQVLQTAAAIAALIPGGVTFRAGLWKPRTRPDTFQGVGAEGLAWLREVKERYGMPVATEVATPEQVRLALEAGIDYLWIGARTSANPIAVQEIADALTPPTPSEEGVKQSNGLRGVFVKNPVNEDTALWIGNIRRLEGVPVYAVLRGCNHRPCWRMAYELRKALPDTPILLDPSHMSGDADKIPALVAKAAELALDGLMIEVHLDPAHALSDNRQQITPDGLQALLGREAINAKQQTRSNKREATNVGTADLVWLRAIMDEVDDRLWEVYSERMQVSREIGELKQQLGLPALQPERWNEVVARRVAWAESKGLNTDSIRTILDAIHRESLGVQTTTTTTTTTTT